MSLVNSCVVLGKNRNREIGASDSCSGSATDELDDFRSGSSALQTLFSLSVKGQLDGMIVIVPFSRNPLRFQVSGHYL